jgi:ubiquinone/menaquinone biosynthesis C-methylase UbiE
MTDSPAALRAEERDEAEKHDLLYHGLAVQQLRMKESDWTKFDTIQAPLDMYTASISRLGPVAGLTVLDAGCGDGWLSVILAKRGAAIVEAFDISEEGVRAARQRAEVNGVAERCRFTTGSFYEIPLPDRSVDVVIGQSILHHLRYKQAAADELFRVMKPGARAIFAEPFGNKLWLERLRLFVPVESEAPEDPGEWARQFKYSDLPPFAKLFEVEVQEIQFLSRVDRIVKWRGLLDGVRKFDRWLLHNARFLRPYARSIVIELRRPTG